MALTKNNVHIMSLQASNIAKCILNDADKIKKPYDYRFTFEFDKDISNTKKYRGSLPFSLDMMELDSKYPKAIQCFKNKDKTKEIQFTDAIIDVKFDFPLKAVIKKPNYKYQPKQGRKSEKLITYKISFGKTIFNEKQLREILYHSGFSIGDTKYVFYKRSSSKSRNGQMLFIDVTMLEHMLSWSRMGLKIEQGQQLDDLPSLKAYESLTLSGLEDTITISPKEILFIDDIEHSFLTSASIASLKDGELVVDEIENFERANSIFDGQALLDESIFNAYKSTKGKGMMLLRNRYFKSCAFNTRLQDYFKDYTRRTGKTDTIDLSGEIRKLSDIKMVATPSSLKLFKFVSALFKDKKECLDFWVLNAGSTFGVCKSEKASFYDGACQLSYQMINSMPLTRSDVRELLQWEIDYIDKLNNDYRVFKHHIQLGDPSASREFVYNLMCVCSDTKDTSLYRDFRRHTVDHYKEQLKTGKILIPNADYCVLFGNPYEMLLSAVGELIADTVHHDKEIYCSGYADGEKLVGFRNPHLCSGNVLVAQNKFHNNLKWFNLTNNIVVINSYDNDIFDRLQGADLDSDTILLTNNSTLLKAGEQCQRFKTPINKIKTSKVHYTNCPQSHADIDNAIADNFIGRIINLSQLLNSCYWNIAYCNDAEQEWYDFESKAKLLQNIYNKISLLSSLSQLELDKAKKFFEFGDSTMGDKIREIVSFDYGADILNVEKVSITHTPQVGITKLEKLISEKKECKDNEKKKVIADEIQKIVTTEIEKLVKPVFFKYNSQDGKCQFRPFNTPMDFVCQIVDEIPKAKPQQKSIPLSSLLRQEDHKKVDRKQIDKLLLLCEEVNILKKSIYAKGLSKKQRKDKEKDYQDEFEKSVTEIRKLRINQDTIINIFNRCYLPTSSKRKSITNRMTLLSLLYKAKPALIKECFEYNRDENQYYLIKSTDGDIEFFGKRYEEIMVFKLPNCNYQAKDQAS
ncbi:MAG: hypothetical protein E7L17_07435 [Clostridium sp.]|uniref:hypothetical protein n=1 Tax=Clostridium sp. TaxID=1506 RepID=UPI00290BDA7C|nr:hypothetical protein [Clostridium sp.]MDU7337928.1 hypothetical protein [Clostridium sp.]